MNRFGEGRARNFKETDVHVAIGPGLKRQIERLARKNERSVSAEIRLAVRAHLQRNLAR